MSARASHLLLLCVLGLGACRERPLTALSSDLSVPPALDFGVVFVGFERAGTLEVTNRGRAPVEFRLAAPAPFSAPEQLRVPGGTSVALEVRLTAQAEGPVSGTLRLEADGLSFDVTLDGVGALPPTCRPSADCLEARFDPATGCVEAPAADGSSCGANDRCLEGGRCQQGLCLGQAVSCDDGDACTTDACSPAQGCVHGAVTCAVPTGPCEVAVCEPARGCGVQPAADGARCGSNDCQTAHVCLAGACEERLAPDGSECGEATSCRGPGRCAGTACSLPPPQVPTPRWRYTPPAGMNVMRVVVDTHGNTFALLGTTVVYAEDAGPPPAYQLLLLSFDGDGNQRFSVNLTQQTAGLENGVALMADPDADRVYLAARTYNYGTATPQRVVVAQARSATTGALLWEHDLHQGIAVANSSTGVMWLDVTRAMLLDPGVLALALVEGESLHQAYVAGLSTATGAELWKVQRSGHLGAGATANGEVWENSAACWSSESFTSRISAAGVSSARAPMWSPLLAFGTDRVLVRTSVTNQVGWLSSSFVLTPVPLPTRHSIDWSVLARLEGPLLTLVTKDETRDEPSLDRYDSVAGAWQWSAPLGPGTVSEVWLLRDGGTATSLSSSDGGTELVTHAATGDELERCPYGTAAGVTVSHGRYVTQERGSITVFDVPGREAATSGWSGPNGFGGTGRAR